MLPMYCDTNEKICRKRIEKYVERIGEKSHNRNQLLTKDGKAKLVLDGCEKECIKLEGYIKFSIEDDFMPMEQGSYKFCILPKNKMIINYDKRYAFLGYKIDNSKGCIFVVHAVTEDKDILIVKIDDDIPILISVDEFYEEDSINDSMYQILTNLLKKAFPNSVSLARSDIKEVKADEWE